IELTITPPNADWLLPPEISPGPCSLLAGGFRLEPCPTQAMPEGIAEIGEQSLIIELKPLLAAGNYEAALARIGLNYGPELLLLDRGDYDAFMGTRTPTDGMPDPGESASATARALEPGDQPIERTATNEAASTRDNRPERPSSSFGGRPGGNTTRASNMPPPDTISASMLYVIGHTYFSLQRYRPAETAFRLALQAGANIRAHESLGMLYLRTERYEDARTHLSQAVQLGRNTALVHSALGYLDVRTRRYSAAASDFQRVLVLAPDDRNAQRGLLLALTETREHDKAAALVEQLLREEPDDRDLWLYRARIAVTANERSSALASLETALRLGDDSVENRRACFELQMESGNVARGVQLLRGLRARDLPFALVDQALGWLANENEWDRFRELLGSVDRAALGGVEQSRQLMRRAALAAHDGNRRAASTALQDALDLDPANADALLALGQIHRTDGDYGRAELLLRRASDYDAVREDALIARAEVASDQENFDGALMHLRNVVDSNPARADLKRNIDLLQNLQVLRTQR
ncbi:MAG TPA: tetratricopeptide repeat protein, partial [Gammaproteobacteria bacterium]|nr:tetratricopeptide repeat protein [Gammaproteobacteria bacterium]